MDNFTKQLIERANARKEAMQQKMQEHSFQPRKRKPLESQENVTVPVDPASEKSAMDGSFEAVSSIASESPNKKVRMELATSEIRLDEKPLKDIKMDVAVKPSSDTKAATNTGSSGMSERLKKIVKQRIQWEAEERGEDVDYESAPSPVRTECGKEQVSVRPVDVARRARLAALADHYKNLEDEVPVFNEEHKPEQVTNTNRRRSCNSLGRKTPMSEQYEADIVQQHSPQVEEATEDPVSNKLQDPPKNGGHSVSAQQDHPKPKAGGTPSSNLQTNRNVSKRISLSIETLSQFVKQPDKPDNSPKLPAGVKSGGKTLSSIQEQSRVPMEMVKTGSNQRKIGPAANTGSNQQQHTAAITKSSSNQLKGAVVTAKSGPNQQQDPAPIARALQSKLLELQKSLNKEAERFSKEKGSCEQSGVGESFGEGDTSLAGDCSSVDTSAVDNSTAYHSAVGADDSAVDDSAIENSTVADDSVIDDSTIADKSAIDESAADSEVESSAMETSTLDANGSAGEYGSEMMETSKVGSSMNDTTEDEVGMSDCDTIEHDVQVEQSLKSVKEDSEDDDGDSFGEQDFEDVIDELFTFPQSETSIQQDMSIVRNKSKKDIRCELNERKQTCNEAEDTHVLSRQSSRHIHQLARSTSTESIPSAPPATFPVFTIENYRTEKRKSIKKVERKVVREEQSAQKPKKAHSRKSFKEKVQELTAAIQRQQAIIQQASAALNCCYDVQHGKGSVTELEADKLLLVATEKRLVLMSELQKLKERQGKESINQACRGAIVIDRIRLLLRTEYIFSVASKKDGGDARSHYYFVLVQCGPNKIFATHLASTHDSLSADSLVFKDRFVMENLQSDFEIVIKVFSVNQQARADGIPSQEKRSHGKLSSLLHGKKASTITLRSLTPRKLRSLSTHGTIAQSPGGPNAVRTSSFGLIGTATITAADVRASNFELTQVPFLSPISGKFACKITTDFQSTVEQRGFLTMFEDVGGLGSWHRRWCALYGGVLYSWTYPDDEKNKPAQSKLEMRSVISDDIRTVERIMCARPNTFELRTMRPRKHGDRDGLITQETGSVITTKHWLAADTKAERESWISSLNQALRDVREWDLDALQPMRR